MSRMRLQLAWPVVAATLLLGSTPAAAQSPAYFTGEVSMLEGWQTGNVAFTLFASGVPCNGQFILNKSDPGAKNLYAMLLTAKASGKTVTVYFTTCGVAEGYGSTSYAQVGYLYLN
jgi:hypothetical protein